MTTVLITGTSRGLGLALTRVFLNSPSTSLIFATARAPTPPGPLQKLIDSSNGKIRYIPLDVNSLESINNAVKVVTTHLSKATSTSSPTKGLDILINNAAVLIYEPNFLTPESLTQTLNTNVISLHTVTSAFLPLLRLSPTKKIVSITSTLGSISLVDTFAHAPVPSYKISKAALNMLNAQYALEYGKEGFTCTVISPGWLKTDLGGEAADLSVEEGAKATWEIIEGLQQERDNGVFRNVKVEGWEGTYDGGNPPW